MADIESTVVEEPVGVTAEPVEGGQPPVDAEGTPPGEGAEPQAPPTPSRASERIRELIERGKEREAEHQREVAELKAQLEEKPVKPVGKADHPDQSGHPALMGQTPDEDGQVVVNGRWVNADDLIARHEMKSELAEVRQLLEGDQKTRKQAALDEAEAAHRQELADAVETRIGEVRELRLPGLSPEQADAVDKEVLFRVQGPLNEAFHAGKFTPEFAEQTIAAAYEETRQLFSLFGAKQLQDNIEYAKKHRVGAAGTAGGEAPKSIHEMTQKEIDEHSKVWAQQAEAQRQRRS